MTLLQGYGMWGINTWCLIWIYHVDCNEWGWAVMKTDNKKDRDKGGKRSLSLKETIVLVPLCAFFRSSLFSHPCATHLPLTGVVPSHWSTSSRVCMGYTLHKHFPPILSPVLSSNRKKEKEREFQLLIVLSYILSGHNLGLSLQTSPPLPNANWIGHPLIMQELMEASFPIVCASSAYG